MGGQDMSSSKVMNLLDRDAKKIYKLTEGTLDVQVINDVISRFQIIHYNDYRSPIFTGIFYEMSNREEQLTNSPKTPDIEEELAIVIIKKRLLQKIIDSNREQQKNPDRKMVPELISYSTTSVSTPTKNRLEEFRNPATGEIVLTRFGRKSLRVKTKGNKLLTPYDLKTLMGLFEIFSERFRENPEKYSVYNENATFEFEFVELLKAMNLDVNGGNYEAVAQSLENIFQTHLEIIQADPEVSKYTNTHYIHPIRKLLIQRSVKHDPSGIKEGLPIRAEVLFEDFIHNSLINGNYFMVSLVFFSELTPTAQLLYMNILEQYPKNRFSINKLVNHLFPESINTRKSKEDIRKGMRTLMDYGFLTNYTEITEKGTTYIEYEVNESYIPNTPPKIEAQLSLF